MKQKVKIAIIDTGIDKNHEYFKYNVFDGIGLESKRDYIFVSDKYEDDNGHGTSCVSIIKKEFEEVEFFVVKALDKLGRANIQILEESLRYLLEIDVKIINLSLSVMESKIAEDLYDICEKLKNQGKIIICSVANGFEFSYPANFDNVIGVKGFILEGEDAIWYNKKYDIQCIIDNNSYLTCDLDNKYSLFGQCNSMAAARLTGKIAKIVYKNPKFELDDLEEVLEVNALRNEWADKDMESSKRYPIFKNEKSVINENILKGVIEIIRDRFKIDESNNEWYECSLFNNNIGLNGDNCFEIIMKLEEKFDIKFDYMNISRYDFISIYTLAELVEKNIEKGKH
ncbi:S8 family serine peptidase [Asaccharospora irregularis]|uniref:Subtilase family protein n=1 Tax=Asaccharospora irregularis DSM 2635 TaxID=1121321 RepID=A0A1M5R4H7_9FIRM|nr:S8 family serine peptidase [Asaccharospora irregularis]SHH21294.1 Subtilase family protein [Asaccharospora irregularis DSM 2635]